MSNYRTQQIVVDQYDGVSVRDYRAALRVLGADDVEMGAYPVSPGDWSLVLAAHDAAAPKVVSRASRLPKIIYDRL